MSDFFDAAYFDWARWKFHVDDLAEPVKQCDAHAAVCQFVQRGYLLALWQVVMGDTRIKKPSTQVKVPAPRVVAAVAAL